MLTFQLPEGAENLQFQDGVLGERYLEVPGGFADTQPVNAGATDYQVLVAFELPYKSKLNIAQPLKLNLNSAVVLLPEKGVKLKSEELVDGGVRDVQGENYLMFTGKPMSAGSSLSIELSGRPDSGASILYSPEKRINLLIGVAALGVVLIIAGVWLYRRERLTREEGLDLEDKDVPVRSTPSALRAGPSPPVRRAWPATRGRTRSPWPTTRRSVAPAPILVVRC